MTFLFKRKESLSQREKKSDLEFKKWQREKIILERNQEIEEEKYNLQKRSWDRKYPFSKLLMMFLFLNFSILEVFTGWVTIQSFSLAYAIGAMPDFTPLITLLGAIIGETLSYGIYSAKSKAENIKGGIIRDLAIQQQLEDNNDNAVG